MARWDLRGTALLVFIVFDISNGGELCYDSVAEAYKYCQGNCCGDQCCTVDVAAIVGIAVAGVIGLAAILAVAGCVCFYFTHASRDSSGWRGTVVHPRNDEESIKATTSVSFTTSAYSTLPTRNGNFTFTLPAGFYLTRERTPISSVSSPIPSIGSHTLSVSPPMSPIIPLSPVASPTNSPLPTLQSGESPPPYSERSDTPPKYQTLSS